MIQRIYATKLMGISDDDLRRLEVAEQERALIEAERIAEEHDIGIDEVLRQAQEIGERILRGGLDAELRRFAQDYGMSEEEARARYEAARRSAASEPLGPAPAAEDAPDGAPALRQSGAHGQGSTASTSQRLPATTQT